MKKSFIFKNLNCYDINCNVIVSIELKSPNTKPVFTASANVKKGRDTIAAGQCLDDIYKCFDRTREDFKLFETIYHMWSKWHLNDLHAGTIAQEEAVDEYFIRMNKSYEYVEAKKYLESIGLLYDKDENDYQYGTSWLYREIDPKDLETIKSLLRGDVAC